MAKTSTHISYCIKRKTDREVKTNKGRKLGRRGWKLVQNSQGKRKGTGSNLWSETTMMSTGSLWTEAKTCTDRSKVLYSVAIEEKHICCKKQKRNSLTSWWYHKEFLPSEAVISEIIFLLCENKWHIFETKQNNNKKKKQNMWNKNLSIRKPEPLLAINIPFNQPLTFNVFGVHEKQRKRCF